MRQTVAAWASAATLAMTCVFLPGCGSGTSSTDTASQSATSEQAAEFTEKEVPIVRAVGEPGTTTLRYYNDMPSVPYVSAANFHSIMIEGQTAEAKKEADGKWTLTSPTGTATVDVDADTITSDDFYAFANTMRMASADSGVAAVACSKLVSNDVEPAQATITFDFGKYGIDIRSDENGVYFPFVSIADIYDNDDTYQRTAFNGEKVYVGAQSTGGNMMMLDPEYYAPIYKQTTRSEDLVKYSYAEWCFVMQNLYGYPGKEAVNERTLREQGLEAALKEQGNAGAKTIELLQSTDMGEYMVGTMVLNSLFDDGHSTLSLVSTSMLSEENAPELYKAYMAAYEKVMADEEVLATVSATYEPALKLANDSTAREAQRKEAIGEEHYVEKGDTAMVVFDAFHGEYDAWRDFYASEEHDLDALLKSEAAETDAIMIVLNGLRKAQANPEIKNFVLDLSNNHGGDSSVMMTIMSLMNGRSYYTYDDVLTGQKASLTYDIDRNFDGKFDEKDDEVNYDFNFAVLTSGASFSCGNALPSMMKDSGMPVMGDRSRGGASMVLASNSAEGIDYTISGYRARLTNEAGENIDVGVPVDIDLYKKDDQGNVKTTDVKVEILGEDGKPMESYTMEDCSQYWDFDVLSKKINEFYGA